MPACFQGEDWQNRDLPGFQIDDLQGGRAADSILVAMLLRDVLRADFFPVLQTPKTEIHIHKAIDLRVHKQPVAQDLVSQGRQKFSWAMLGPVSLLPQVWFNCRNLQNKNI